MIRNLRVGKIMAPIASRPLMKEFNDAWEDDLITIPLLGIYRHAIIYN